MTFCSVNASNWSGEQTGAGCAFNLMEAEGFGQALERVVGRAVVDDDDLVVRVLESEQRTYRLDDPGSFVESGEDESDRHPTRGVDEISDVQRLESAHILLEVDKRQEARRHVDRIQSKEVDEDHGADNGD